MKRLNGAVRKKLYAVVALAMFALPAAAGATDGQMVSVTPYIDQSQVLEAGQTSFYKVPWRGWTNTARASKKMNGIGMFVPTQVMGNPEPLFQLMSESGVKLVRYELNWGGTISGDNQSLTPDAKRDLDKFLKMTHKYGMRPIIMLNSNDNNPTPSTLFSRSATQAFSCIPVDESDHSCDNPRIFLDSLDGIVVNKTGLDLENYGDCGDGKACTPMRAEFIVTSMDTSNNSVVLSKPLPIAVAERQSLPFATLSYSPLWPVGTAQFEDSADGWVNHFVKIVADEVGAQIHNDDYSLEIWNELTFAAGWLNAAKYYSPLPPEIALAENINRFKSGGSAWELASRTADFMTANHPKVEMIWGFSNTCAFCTPISDLPSNFDAKSFHPYGAAYNDTADIDQKAIDANIDGYIPPMRLSVPESIKMATSGWNSDQMLGRILAPWNRKEAGTTENSNNQNVLPWYFTEHGISPMLGLDIHDAATAHEIKARYMLRSLALYLNLGVKGITMESAWTSDDADFGLTNAIDPASRNFTVDKLRGPEMKALKNFTAAFGGTEDFDKTRDLPVDVASTGPQQLAFSGDATHPASYLRDWVTFLPYQVTASKFVIPIYMMTLDGTVRANDQKFQFVIHNVNGLTATPTWYDPISNRTENVTVAARAADSITVQMSVSDSVRLLTLDNA